MEARPASEVAVAAAPGAALLERALELETLAQSISGARDGRGSVVFVEGAPGLGSSVLLERAADMAEAEGLEVLSAVGRELEREFTFGVALQLFESRVSGARPDEAARLLAGGARLAGPLLSPGPRAALPDDGEAFSVFHGLYWLCANLAADTPLALIVDDLHWSDAASRRFVLYLASRVADLPICLVVAADLRAWGREVPELVELAAGNEVRALTLAPLDPSAVEAAVQATLGRPLDDAFARACFRGTRGNPFIVQALADELAVSGIDPHAGNAGRVGSLTPPGLQRWVATRIARLAPGAGDLARAAAILGDGAEQRHAALLAGLDPLAASPIVNALTTAGILRRAERLAFAEPLVRRTVETALTPAELADAHLEAARLLDAERAPEARVVSHLLRARCTGSAWAVETLSRAARTATDQGEPDTAVRYLRRALEEPPLEDVLGGLVRELGRAEALAGKPQAASRLAEAVRLTSDPHDRAIAVLEAGRTLCTHGRFDEAAQIFRSGLEEREKGDDPLTMRLEAAHALALRLSGRDVPSKLSLSPAAVDAYAADSAAGRVLLARLAFERALRGEPVDGLRELARAALGRGALLDVETSDGLSYYLATTALVLSEDVQAAELALTAAVEDARDRGSRVGLATACGFRAWAILRRGRLAQAEEDAEKALEVQRGGWRVFLPAAHGVLADVMLERGDLDEAAVQIAQADDAPGRGDALSAIVGQVGRARLDLARGRPAAALAALEATGQRLEEVGVTSPSAVPWRGWAALACAALGDETRARELADEEVALARRMGLHGVTGRSLQTRASFEQGEAKLDFLREAVAELEGSQLALSRAHAFVALGASLRRATKRRDAREPLRQGLDLAERCGATALVRYAGEELAAAGARPRRTAMTGAGALTPRERQVAKLAATGVSNRAIAEELVVTIKTVEWHLRQSFIKLGVSSRAELAQALAASG